ncbi:MAG: zf-HC2 domain-containing protein [Eubacteriales bacterium]|nr:zf-HC2 domain-containing protein [Eubacteriales bacterium]
MKCREAQDLFSPYLDEELTAVENRALKAHLNACVTCREEIEVLRSIAEALRAQVYAVKAPAGFASAVRSQIAGEQRREVASWFGGWRRGVAAAVASIMILGGSLGYGATQLWNRGAPVLIGQEDPDTTIVEVRNPVENPVTPAGQPTPGTPVVPSETDTPTDSDPVVSEPVTPVEDPGTVDSDVPRTKPSASNTIMIASVYEEKVFLSKQRAISSTMLKVSVEDVKAARDKAFNLGATYGASFLPAERISNGQVEILRLTVGREQAEILTTKLGALGQVMARDTETKDITSQFDRTREQYQSLLAKRATVADANELAELDATLRSLERQLTEWDYEAERHVIILWLQSGM